MKQINIIGAGILGAATAYELTLRGHQVNIIDKEAEGRATSAAAGIICPWISKRRNKAWYELARLGARHYHTLIANLEKDGEINTGYKKVGAIKLHQEEHKLVELKEIALKRKELAPEIGKITLLSQEDVREKIPFLRDDLYGLAISGAARVDGDALRGALLRAAQKRGATFIKGEAELLVEEEKIIGIHVNSDNIFADWTIATNGVWMNDLLQPLHPGVKFRAQKGQTIHLETKQFSTENMPVIQPPNNQYILPSKSGKVIIGATHEEVKHLNNTSPTTEGVHYILDQAKLFAPDLLQANLSDIRVGFRPFTKNHLPVFGPTHPYQQMLIANGLGASGLTTGPIIARQLALMVSKLETDVDISHYDISLAT